MSESGKQRPPPLHLPSTELKAKASVAWSEQSSFNEGSSSTARGSPSQRATQKKALLETEEMDAASKLQPTSRARNQLLVFLVVAVASIALAMGAGIPLTGRVYDVTISVDDPLNGKFTSGWQLVGMHLQVYLGTFGFMLFGNFIPGFVVLRLPYRLYILLMAALLCSFLVAMALCIALLIKPELTYTNLISTGGQDPVTSSSGVFFFFSFAFLAGLCIGILLEHFSSARVRVGPNSRHEPHHHTPVSTRPDTWYGRAWHWLASTRVGKCTGFLLAHGRRKAVGFIALSLVLGFSVSCFLCNPVGAANETYAAVFFRSKSIYSLVNWEWNNDFVYKLFPDVLVFYLFFAVISIGSMILHSHTKAKHFLHRRIWVPKKIPMNQLRWHPFPVGVSAGEVILWVLFLGLTIYWMCYWGVDFTYMRDKIEKKSVYDVDTEVAGRMVGHLSNLFLSFVMLPASRTGVLVEIFGVPYERTLKYHRLLGLLSYIVVTLHAVIFWAKFANEGYLLRNVVAYNNMLISPVREAHDDFTMTIVELSWLLLTISLLMAVFMRRSTYEWFQYSHKYIGIVFYITAIIHGWTTWYYVIIGLLVWMCDKWSRSIAASKVYIPETVEWHDRNETTLMKLSYASLSNSYEPGQYFFVNIPEISLNEWHPFTASAVLDDGIVFCIKRMGSRRVTDKGSWTQRLAEKVIAQPAEGLQASDSPLSIRLSGPFGHTDFRDYERMLLIAGGIGITPMIAIFASLKKKQLMGESIGRLKYVQLVWMSRSVGEFRLFEQIFSLLVKDNTKAAVKAEREGYLDPIPEVNLGEEGEDDDNMSDIVRKFAEGFNAANGARGKDAAAKTAKAATLKSVTNMTIDIPPPPSLKVAGGFMEHSAVLQATLEQLEEEFGDDLDFDFGGAPGSQGSDAAGDNSAENSQGAPSFTFPEVNAPSPPSDSTVDAVPAAPAEKSRTNLIATSFFPPPSSLPEYSPTLPKPFNFPPATQKLLDHANASASTSAAPATAAAAASASHQPAPPPQRRSSRILPPPAASHKFVPKAAGSAMVPPSPSPSTMSKISIKSVGEQACMLSCNFELGLFCTKRESFVSLTDPDSVDFVKLFIRSGRCNLADAFEQAKLSGPDCVAAVCGPPALTMDVSRMAWERGCDFHSETFLF